MDNLTSDERSEIMSRVKSKNTRPEILVRSFLHRHGFRFRVNQTKLPGKPDIVLPKYKTVVFVNGCFWHQHPSPDCKLARMPKSNIPFWRDKLESNRERDRKKKAALEAMGWRVLCVWECELTHPEQSLQKLLDEIRTNASAGPATE